MSLPFNAGAQFYDLLYRDKDYKGEVDYISTLIRRYVDRTPEQTRLLDLACGTGRHALILKDRGFDVEGSDGSKEMIQVAREASKTSGKSVVFHDRSFQNCNELPKGFNAIISMFAAIDYITLQDELILSLRNIREILAPDGIFAFDFWQGSAVVVDYDPVRVLRRKLGDQEILRISETSLDQKANLATVKFTCMYFENNVRKAEFEEIHTVRYFYLKEMLKVLADSGFKLLYLSPFKELDKPLGERDWYASLVVQRIPI